MAYPEIPLKPIGKEEIHKLEYSLLISSLVEILTDPKFLEQLKDPRDRLTWIDSIATAAAALARDKAGMTLSDIADDIGRTEATIKKHLKGETEAGKIVLEAYKKLEKGELDTTLSVLLGLKRADYLEEVKAKIDRIIDSLNETINMLKEISEKL
ncbi:MAG: regulator [Thermoproteota archaeon]|nr:regulator [Deltaproteobacteria bacterium]RLG42786.1 MAG: regulator [Candidatus Korarchaeota archaeon]